MFLIDAYQGMVSAQHGQRACHAFSDFLCVCRHINAPRHGCGAGRHQLAVLLHQAEAAGARGGWQAAAKEYFFFHH